MSFTFATAGKIVFGEGSAADITGAVSALGRRPLLVTGASQERASALIASLGAVPFAVAGEPTLGRVREGVAEARKEGCDVVVSMGGGSAIDAGKAIAALLTNSGSLFDYLEVVGLGLPLLRASAPFVAIPTTAGTGSEVTFNAVLASPEDRVKASLRSPLMLARLAVIDPQLTSDLPRAITASTGLDALTQVIEPYVSVRANMMTDAYCVEGIRRAATALPRAWENGADSEARTAMSYASLMGGLSLANAGLGAVHGFAAPLGGMFPIPHGAACAAVLPHAMEINIRALRQRDPESRALARYGEIARLLTGRPHAEAEDGIGWTRELCLRLEIPRLGAYGVGDADIPLLVSKAARASSMRANALALTTEEMREILSLSI